MSEDLLRRIAAELNNAPGAAERTVGVAALITDVNARISSAALSRLPFDSSPYGYQAWLAGADQS